MSWLPGDPTYSARKAAAVDQRRLNFIVSGQRHQLRADRWEELLGPKPPVEWDGCNGCSRAPDTYMGYQLWPACFIHDWHYCPDGPDVPRVLADLVLRLNLWRIMRLQGCPWWRAAYVAMTYWTAVTAAGAPHYKRRIAD